MDRMATCWIRVQIRRVLNHYAIDETAAEAFPLPPPSQSHDLVPGSPQCQWLLRRFVIDVGSSRVITGVCSK
jgi:hypothetical protein